MPYYYVKEDDFIYRFVSMEHLSELTKKGRDEYPSGCSLAYAVRSEFRHADIASRQGAQIKGWIERNGEICKSYKHGNFW